MIGMAIASLLSACLASVDFLLLGVHFDNLNSIGLFIVIINFASQMVIYLFLPDLPKVEDYGSVDKESVQSNL